MCGQQVLDIPTCAALSKRDGTPGDINSTRSAVSGGAEQVTAGVRGN